MVDLEKGESRIQEFKAELPADSQKWIKTIVAFANGAGGELVLGVDNQRKLTGIPRETDIFALKDKISDTIGQMCEPQIMYDIYQETIEEKLLMVVHVFPGNNTPYYIKSMGKENGTFIRLNATTRTADFTTIDELELRGKRRSYDELPFTDLEIKQSDIDSLCKDFSERCGKNITQELLENMHLFQKIEGQLVPTKAYAIFLGKHDFTSKIQCARFRGTERVNFLDKKDYDGPLLNQIESAYKFVLNYLSMSIEIDGLYRKEIYELPVTAIRELILNAAVHRNYMQSSCIQVAVYDDRVEISSPGSLFGSLTLEEALQGRSSIRNKIIASICDKLEIMEGWGTGLKRIIDMCHEYGVRPPEFIEIGDLLRVNFYRPSFSPNSNANEKCPRNVLENEKCPRNVLENEKCPKELPENCKETFYAIKANPYVTSLELAKLLEQTERNIRRHIAKLKELNIIERIGSDTKGHWKIVEQIEKN